MAKVMTHEPRKIEQYIRSTRIVEGSLRKVAKMAGVSPATIHAICMGGKIKNETKHNNMLARAISNITLYELDNPTKKKINERAAEVFGFLSGQEQGQLLKAKGEEFDKKRAAFREDAKKNYKKKFRPTDGSDDLKLWDLLKYGG